MAHSLSREGISTVVLEHANVPGGLIRSEHPEGALCEPHGSHRHRVDILADGKVFNWPILLSYVYRRSDGREIHRQLEQRRHVNATARAEATHG